MYKIEVQRFSGSFRQYFISDINVLHEAKIKIEKEFDIELRGQQGTDYFYGENGEIEVMISNCYMDLYNPEQIINKIKELVK